jgi:hypothetical protein
MKSLYLLFGLCLAGVLIFSCKPEAEDADDHGEAVVAMTRQDSIDRGEYLVTIMGCHDCHSPKIFTPDGRMMFDSTRLLSGHPADEILPKITDKAMVKPGQWILMGPNVTAFVGPWGTSFAANLTPDPSGIGSWTFDQFKKAFAEGKFKGMDNGRPVMPPMPWEMFSRVEPGDMYSIWLYLNTLPQIQNVVPAYIPPGQ